MAIFGVRRLAAAFPTAITPHSAVLIKWLKRRPRRNGLMFRRLAGIFSQRETRFHRIMENLRESGSLRTLTMDLTILDLSAYLGLTAVGAITVNMLLGTLMAFRYSPVRDWPHRRFNYFRLHNWTGYIALAVTILHPVTLLLNKTPDFRLVDILYPIHSPQQPLENTIGAIALYVIACVVVTSYLRIRLGRRLWKAFHFTVYLAAAALFYHSLFTDPDLKHAPIDWFDGGKIFVEACTLIIAVTSILRWRHSRQKAHLAQRVPHDSATHPT